MREHSPPPVSEGGPDLGAVAHLQQAELVAVLQYAAKGEVVVVKVIGRGRVRIYMGYVLS